ncbi:hypothetical protein U1Q18_024934, partial [Sarracenia purpurea var. burkii]
RLGPQGTAPGLSRFAPQGDGQSQQQPTTIQPTPVTAPARGGYQGSWGGGRHQTQGRIFGLDRVRVIWSGTGKY